jgi:TM2 domain-containing membrane protein YozV
MIVSGGNGIGIIVLIFWATLIGAIVLLIMGAVCNISRR